jgi:hypothetical protein
VHNNELHDFDAMKSGIGGAGRVERWKVSAGRWRCIHTIIRTWALEQHATKVAEDRQMDSSLLLGNGTSGSTTSGEVLD